MSGSHICGVITFPGRYHIDPEPAAWCETEVAEEGDLCPAHDEDDRADEAYERFREDERDGN